MYMASKPNVIDGPMGTTIIPGAIVPLHAIRQSCQLIPLVSGHGGLDDSERVWPREWKSNQVLNQCNTFLLNNWASKYSYQTLW